MEPSVEGELDEIASSARQMIAFIDGLSQPTIAALDAARWHSGKTFSLRAELARIIECAAKAKLGTRVKTPASPR
jgi:hypothetical protein